MHGAAFALIVNIAVACLFATSFGIIALINSTHRSSYAFGLSYAIGMLTPISELVLPLSPWPEPFMISSYFCFMAGLLTMSAALAGFYRKAVPWRMIMTVFVSAVFIRWLLWNGQRNTLSYEVMFQLPFVIASGMPAWVILRFSQRRPLEVAAGATFGIVALHFLIKPFLAVAFGSGGTAAEYISSFYALLSQASTGILLTAAGLMILLIILQSIVQESRSASETDPLSGLANRRGFDLRAAQAVSRARELGLPVSVAVFDIDHFKSINDTFGHATGDDVIRGFAELLQQAAPHAAVVGRMGGEEFALLFEHTNQEGARLNAEAIRIAASQTSQTLMPAFTASGGVATVLSTETLSDAMRRADAALYKAKRFGRDRICLPDEVAFPSSGRLHAVS